MPYTEVAHLSDRAFRVSGQSLEELFQQAASAMYSVMMVQVFGAGIHRSIALDGTDTESLLVMYLSELLAIAEMENLAVYASVLLFSDHSLRADLALAPILSKVENIKAVTFAQMNITRTESSLETNIVFDI